MGISYIKPNEVGAVNWPFECGEALASGDPVYAYDYFAVGYKHIKGAVMKYYSTLEKIMGLLGLLAACFLFVVAYSYIVHAEEIHIHWDANTEPDIQCYRIYMGAQVDMADWTWEQIGEVAVSATEFIYDVPTTALRLFRVSACDQAGQESVRYNAGVFSCPDWVPPFEPSKAGIE